MANFTTRVELHRATGDDYERLHDQMARHGFRRTVPGFDGQGSQHTYHLPTAEYDSVSDGSAASVRDVAKRVADGVRPDAWVLVTKVADRSWHTAVAA